MPPIVNAMPTPADFNLTGTSGANAAQTVTQAAPGLGKQNVLAQLEVSWSGGAVAAGTKVEVKDGTTVVYTEYLGDGTSVLGKFVANLPAPLVASPNATLSVVVDAAGAGVTTKVSGAGWVLPK